MSAIDHNCELLTICRFLKETWTSKARFLVQCAKVEKARPNTDGVFGLRFLDLSNPH